MPTRPNAVCPRGHTKPAGKPCPQCRRAYDQQRGSSTQRGYSYRWQAYVRQYKREHPFCVDCKADGLLTPATDIDHIRAVTGPHDPLFWEPSNHQPLCSYHHRIKSIKYDGGFGRTKEDR